MSVYIRARNDKPSKFITLECDDCGVTLEVARPYDKSGEMIRIAGGRVSLSSIDERKARRSLQGAGWGYKGNLSRCICASCVAKPVAPHSLIDAAQETIQSETKESPTMPDAVIPPENQLPPPWGVSPRPVRYAISAELDVVYDREKGRYRGRSSDKTVAKNQNVPEAWVAGVRELLYGDSAKNEDDAKRSEDIERLAANFGKLETFLYQQLETLEALKKELAELRGEVK